MALTLGLVHWQAIMNSFLLHRFAPTARPGFPGARDQTVLSSPCMPVSSPFKTDYQKVKNKKGLHFQLGISWSSCGNKHFKGRNSLIHHCTCVYTWSCSRKILTGWREYNAPNRTMIIARSYSRAKFQRHRYKTQGDGPNSCSQETDAQVPSCSWQLPWVWLCRLNAAICVCHTGGIWCLGQGRLNSSTLSTPQKYKISFGLLSFITPWRLEMWTQASSSDVVSKLCCHLRSFRPMF